MVRFFFLCVSLIFGQNSSINMVEETIRFRVVFVWSINHRFFFLLFLLLLVNVVWKTKRNRRWRRKCDKNKSRFHIHIFSVHERWRCIISITSTAIVGHFNGKHCVTRDCCFSVWQRSDHFVHPIVCIFGCLLWLDQSVVRIGRLVSRPVENEGKRDTLPASTT